MHVGTIAEGAPIIPISAQLKYNIDAVCEYVVKKIPVPIRDFTSEPRLIGKINKYYFLEFLFSCTAFFGLFVWKCLFYFRLEPWLSNPSHSGQQSEFLAESMLFIQNYLQYSLIKLDLSEPQKHYFSK